MLNMNDLFLILCNKMEISGITKEFKFHPTRRWRIDYAIPEIKLAIELEGGAYIRGRHVRPTGFVNDMEKYNALSELGWVLLRYQPTKIDYQQIKKVYDKLRIKIWQKN
jgi:very-short-patch-repair endonuclease